MANLFSNMTTDGMEESQDRLGGYQPLESGIYEATIKALYVTMAKSGAMGINVVADIHGQEYRETIYVSNRNGQNFFLNKQNPEKKIPLPGFTIINDICLITTEKPLSEQESEEKVINIYNADTGREEPTAVPVLIETIGKKVALGIIHEKRNKTKKEGDQYVPTDEIRDVNVIAKVFHPELKLTVAEARDGREATFWDKWDSAFKGKIADKTEKVDGTAGNPVAGKTKEPTQAPKKSLFGKK